MTLALVGCQSWEVQKTIVNFNAGVFLIKHREKGYILYDTGYSMDILKNNLKYFLYRFANPITLKREDMIDYQLKEKGISPDEIKYIIISHLHPDHIGGLKFFPNSYLILTKTCYNDYKLKKDGLLIFDELLPEDFEKRLIIIDDFKENTQFPYRESCDLFSDLSMFLVEVSGHTIPSLMISQDSLLSLRASNKEGVKVGILKNSFIEN